VVIPYLDCFVVTGREQVRFVRARVKLDVVHTSLLVRLRVRLRNGEPRDHILKVRLRHEDEIHGIMRAPLKDPDVLPLLVPVPSLDSLIVAPVGTMLSVGCTTGRVI
jgi:hypothetical protein